MSASGESRHSLVGFRASANDGGQDTDCLTRLTGDEQKAVKTTAFYTPAERFNACVPLTG